VLDGEAPDPQLHSHVVVTSAVREDGRIVAVASRPVFRAAREVGAYYRSALAQELKQRGHAIERATGKEGRFFEIAGVPRSVIESFSARGREVVQAIERFRAQHGRAPEVGELQTLKLENRRAKVVVTKVDLQRAWNETGTRHDFDADRLVPGGTPAQAPESSLADRIEQRLTERAATFPASELRAVAL
jgi:conjugative relaxase-like TrwC/TraI family protein